MNIRTRLSLLFALLVASIILLFSLVIYYLYSQYREAEFFTRLKDRATTTAKLFDDVGADGKSGDLMHRIEHDDLAALYAGHITIYAENNQAVYKSDNSPVQVDPSFLNQVRVKKEVEVRQGEVEIVGLRHQSRQGPILVVIVSATDRYGFSKLSRLREILIIGWIASLSIVVLAGWFFAGDALKPVSEIIDQVNDISATNIHARLRVGRQNDELAKLAVTFNEMLNRLEEAFVAQRNFVSHASHELRTPLTVMIGQVDVTLMQERTNAEYKHTLEVILEEGKKMNDLVNGLLDLARANSDAASLPFSPLRVDELLWQARGVLLQKKPNYQIDIEYGNLPEREEELMLSGEEMLLRTAFMNLMENGCKYSPDHRVEVNLQAEQQVIRLTFTDHGIGISPTDLPHIFNTFYRSENTIGVAGHGIGLALTSRIINLHSGVIEVESIVDQGTSFFVTFAAGEATAPTNLQPHDANVTT